MPVSLWLIEILRILVGTHMVVNYLPLILQHLPRRLKILTQLHMLTFRLANRGVPRLMLTLVL